MFFYSIKINIVVYFYGLYCHNDRYKYNKGHINMRFKQNYSTKESQKNTSNLLSNNLSMLLKQHNLNISQISQLLDIPVMTIRRLLSGETEDPRISTLKLIADYFHVSVDFLIGEDSKSFLMAEKKVKSYLIPKISWDSLSEINHPDLLKQSTEWESISLNNDEAISTNAFALESKPSMHPRFPRGTAFIIDPETTAKDGDIVLIKFKDNPDYAMKELIIDPPEWRLVPLVADSHTIQFQQDMHAIAGVVILTLLYNSRFQGS
jgi:transcriptional regulator with XRE-family HTH domain